MPIHAHNAIIIDRGPGLAKQVQRLIAHHLDTLFLDDAQRNVMDELELLFIQRFEWRKAIAQYLAIDLADSNGRSRRCSLT